MTMKRKKTVLGPWRGDTIWLGAAFCCWKIAARLVEGAALKQRC
jgi:hypothetical protein